MDKKERSKKMSNNPLAKMIMEQKPQSLLELKQSFLTNLHKIALLGLWRSGFFEYAAFYGGTALSLVYGLDRFSDDLDFSLLKPNEDFCLDVYLEGVRKEVLAWGLVPEIVMNEKKSGSIRTAFLKVRTLNSLKLTGIPDERLQGLHRDEKSSVKIEIDTMPPCSFQSEFCFLLNPMPFSIRVMDLKDMYAGKMHALIGRKWKERIKGRDWYDFIWFQKNLVELKLKHLEEKLKKSKHINENSELTLSEVKQFLKERVENINFEQAKSDVVSFVKDPRQIENWSQELFMEIAEMIMTV